METGNTEENYWRKKGESERGKGIKNARRRIYSFQGGRCNQKVTFLKLAVFINLCPINDWVSISLILHIQRHTYVAYSDYYNRGYTLPCIAQTFDRDLLI